MSDLFTKGIRERNIVRAKGLLDRLQKKKRGMQGFYGELESKVSDPEFSELKEILKEMQEQDIDQIRILDEQIKKLERKITSTGQIKS